MDNIDPNDPTREDYEAAWEDWPDFLDNPEPQELHREDYTGNATKRKRWFYVARYLEEDAHSRNCGKEMFCECTVDGFSKRGLRLNEWWEVWAGSVGEAKHMVENGLGAKHT